MSVELFRYRGATKDGGTLEYVFEAGEQNSPNAVTKEKAVEIAADFMTTFYHVQVGELETQEFRTSPIPYWLVCFSDAIKGPMRQMFFVLLPDGTVCRAQSGEMVVGVGQIFTVLETGPKWLSLSGKILRKLKFYRKEI